MAEIEIYTTNTCPYCVRAKELFKRKNTFFKEIDVTNDPDLREAMTAKAGGRRSVPQIFINGKHVGGCDDLYALDQEGKLDPMLQG
jgi:glutaredoxin 3